MYLNDVDNMYLKPVEHTSGFYFNFFHNILFRLPKLTSKIIFSADFQNIN